MIVIVTFVGAAGVPFVINGGLNDATLLRALSDGFAAEFNAVTATQIVVPGTTPVAVYVVMPDTVEPTNVNGVAAEHAPVVVPA